MMRAKPVRETPRLILMGCVIALLLVALTAPLAAAAPTGLVASTSSNRSNPVTLNGASLSGKRYIFVTGYSQARRVRFTLDGGSSVTRSSPFDYAGTASNGRANALDTAGLANGPHTLTATVTRSSGAVIADLTATFTVANQAPVPPPPPPLLLHLLHRAPIGRPHPGRRGSGSSAEFWTPRSTRLSTTWTGSTRALIRSPRCTPKGER